MGVNMDKDPSKRRPWTTFIPRPGSRRSSVSLSGDGRSFSFGSNVEKVVVPILAPPMEGREMSVPISTPTGFAPAVPPCDNPTFIPSSSASSSSLSREGRPSSSSGWLGGGATVAGFKRSNGSKVKEVIVPILARPTELNVSDSSETPVVSTFVTVPTSDSSRPADMSRTLSYDSPSSSSHPTRPKLSSLLTSSLKSSQALEHQASQLIANAAERTGSLKSPDQSKNGGSFSRSFTSMIGGLSSLSLSRTSTRESYVEDKERGRSLGKTKRPKSASQAPAEYRYFNRSTSRARSQSPFSLRRLRTRESSPAPEALPLSQSEADLSVPTTSLVPRSTAFTDDDSGDETLGTEAEPETEYGSSSDDDIFDLITERNTERNALIPPVVVDPAVAVEIEDPDPVGEGVNIVVAPEPYFPSSLNTMGHGKKNPRRRKSVKTHEPLPFRTSRPVFQRDRCTITITQGDPEGTLGTRKMRQYVVASDLSQESRYAVEWGIGTVLRDGDEMLIVTVVENDSKGLVVNFMSLPFSDVFDSKSTRLFPMPLTELRN